MFTGIVEETGAVLGVEDGADGRRVTVATSFEDLDHGQSISVSGACLTVEEYGSGDPPAETVGTEGSATASGAAESGDRNWFSVFLAEETLDRTWFDELGVGDRVNLERAMPADGRFDGHVVQGHVDATAEVTRVERVGGEPGDGSESDADETDGDGGDWWYAFSLPEPLSPYLVEKGSITVDGISLTVAERGEAEFSVAIVPTTREVTTLSERSVGDPVHLEVDVLAKYVERQLQGSNSVRSG